MSNPGFAGGLTEMAQVRKVRVAIRADGLDYEGYVHLLEAGARVQDVLNDPRPFLNLTEVVVGDQAFSYVALNKGAITHLLILESAPAETEAAAPVISEAARAAASQPSVPAVGPSTIPGPAPTPRAARLSGDPPTQPFPREAIAAARLDDDDDLLLDEDDGDDIDPDDLERDVGALITGPSR